MSDTFTARFSAQVWINDNAMEVDAQGPTTWDCTKAVSERADYFKHLAAGEPGGWQGEVLDNDDVLKSDPEAPEWVREWSGPFSIWVSLSSPEYVTVTIVYRASGDSVEKWQLDLETEIPYLDEAQFVSVQPGITAAAKELGCADDPSEGATTE